MIADPKHAAITFALIVSFAALITTHVALLFGLATRKHPLGALLGLVLPPIAPILGWKSGMRVRAIGWAILISAYGTALLLAR